MQINNMTESGFNFSAGQEQEADPRILAKSFSMYKISNFSSFTILSLLTFVQNVCGTIELNAVSLYVCRPIKWVQCSNLNLTL